MPTPIDRHSDTRALRDVLQEIKDEVRDFVITRLDILKVELNEKKARVKSALPLLAAGAVLAIGAFFAFTFALIAVAATLIEGPWAWAIGAAIVFALYAIAGGALAWMGYKEVSTEGLAPERTLRVLKQDQQWIQNEARRSA